MIWVGLIHHTFVVQSEVMRFGRQNSDDSGEEEMYERAASELTATKLPRKTVSETTHLAPRPARKVNTYITVDFVDVCNIVYA